MEQLASGPSCAWFFLKLPANALYFLIACVDGQIGQIALSQC